MKSDRIYNLSKAFTNRDYPNVHPEQIIQDEWETWKTEGYFNHERYLEFQSWANGVRDGSDYFDKH